MEDNPATRIPAGCGLQAVPFWRVLLPLFVFRYACHALMLLPVLLNERLPAPSLPDRILSHVPFVPWVGRWNYVLWLLCYVPPAIWIGLKDRRVFVRLVITDGLLALARGVLIPLTGLGPVGCADVNALHPFSFWPTWLSLLDPLKAIWGNDAGLYLTKDLFFSGHIATTFLLYLFSRRFGRASRVFLLLNLFTLAVVYLSHLHYTIDVVAAYAISYGMYRASETWWARRESKVLCVPSV
jgi:uncharacterized membrane protein (DUF373 family)